jgi:hypothetical protein
MLCFAFHFDYMYEQKKMYHINDIKRQNGLFEAPGHLK